MNTMNTTTTTNMNLFLDMPTFEDYITGYQGETLSTESLPWEEKQEVSEFETLIALGYTADDFSYIPNVSNAYPFGLEEVKTKETYTCPYGYGEFAY